MIEAKLLSNKIDVSDSLHPSVTHVTFSYLSGATTTANVTADATANAEDIDDATASAANKTWILKEKWQC